MTTAHGRSTVTAAPAATDRPPTLPTLAALAGSILAISGSLLDWSVVEHQQWGTTELTGTDGDGVYTLIASALAALLLLAGVLGKRALIVLGAAAPALVAVGFALRTLADPDRFARAYIADELGATGERAEAILNSVVECSLTTYPWLVLAGAGLAALGAVIAGARGFNGRRRSEPTG
ncbi:hypothetical protein [Streptomyces sp. NPDC127098]|uniref:hypothetical protein n=1 Tax=Streptomyces sp. NPDC127098 TaxID=3347137 RepID=UPI003654A3F9